MIMEGGGSWMPDNTVEPSGGVVGLIQLNNDEGRCCLGHPSEMLTKAALLLLLYPAAQVLWLGSHVVMFSTCGLQTYGSCCGFIQLVVRCCCILLCRIYSWAVPNQ